MVTYRLDSQAVNFRLECQAYLNNLNPLILATFYYSACYELIFYMLLTFSLF